MPTYEYRCPSGHTFELFQRMSDDPPTACEVCGEGPVERVLFAPVIHFKGSGFYTTDYGRNGRKREAGGDGASEGAKSDKPAEKAASGSEGTKASGEPSAKSSSD
jgi:putative FmdB family regulatory protein